METTGAFIKNIVLSGSFNSIEDLSVDYAQRQDTSNGVPDAGGTAALLTVSFGLLGLARNRFSAKV